MAPDSCGYQTSENGGHGAWMTVVVARAHCWEWMGSSCCRRPRPTTSCGCSSRRRPTWWAARPAGCGPSATAGARSRSGISHRWPTGATGVAEAPVALSDPGLSDQVLHRAERARRGLPDPPGAREICRLVGEEGRSVASVARTFGVGWHAAWAAVCRPRTTAGRRSPPAPRGPGPGRRRAQDAGRRAHPPHRLCHPAGRHRPPRAPRRGKDRSAASVSTWLGRRTRYFRDHVEVAAIDPHAGYRKALVSSLPRATITVDVFHAVKLANAAVDDVRRRVQRETLGHRGRNDDPLYGIRRLLTRGYERLSDKQRARITEALRRGDPYDEVGGAGPSRNSSAGSTRPTVRPRPARVSSASTNWPARPAPPRSSGWPRPSSGGRPKSSPSSPPVAPTPGAKP